MAASLSCLLFTVRLDRGICSGQHSLVGAGTDIHHNVRETDYHRVFVVVSTVCVTGRALLRPFPYKPQTVKSRPDKAIAHRALRHAESGLTWL
jgi:hypothetical protein